VQNNTISELRTRAEENLLQNPVPSKKNENYRYLSLKGLRFDITPQKPSILKELPFEVSSLAQEEAGLVLVRSGSSLAPKSCADELKSQGVVFFDFKTALEHDFEPLKEGLELPASIREDLFANLVQARWQNGMILYVPKGVKVRGTLRGLHYFDEASEAFYHRTLIIAEEDSEFSYVDEFLSDSDDSLGGPEKSPLACGLVEIRAARGAKVHYFLTVVSALSFDFISRFVAKP
jgi:Fe-S cluster assembly protein SufD